MNILLAAPATKEIGIDKYINHLRYYLLDTLNIKINNTDSMGVINRVIKERINGFTDKKGVRIALKYK